MAGSQKATVGKELVWISQESLADFCRTPVRSDDEPQVIALTDEQFKSIVQGETQTFSLGNAQIAVRISNRIDRVMLVKEFCVFWLEPESFAGYLASGTVGKYLMAWTPEGIDSNSRDRNRLS